MIYAEAAYFDGNHCQHCADRLDALALKRQRAAIADRWARNRRSTRR